MHSHFQNLLRGVLGVVRKYSGGSNTFVFYCIFMAKFFIVFWEGTRDAPSLPLCASTASLICFKYICHWKYKEKDCVLWIINMDVLIYNYVVNTTSWQVAVFGCTIRYLTYVYRSLILCPACLFVLSLSSANQLTNSMELVADTRLINLGASAAILILANLLRILIWTISNLYK